MLVKPETEVKEITPKKDIDTVRLKMHLIRDLMNIVKSLLLKTMMFFEILKEITDVHAPFVMKHIKVNHASPLV